MALTADELKSLCDFDPATNTYISKSGQAYADALKALFYPNDEGNRNDKPFLEDDILEQPTLSQFRFGALDQFKLNCKLKAVPMKLDKNGDLLNLNGRSKSREQVIAYDFVDADAETIFNNSVGVAYIITCPINGEEHIIKIGQTGGTFKDRLGSYNCGYVINWRTASTTNIKIVQSFVATRKEFNLYIRDCGMLARKYKWARRSTALIASPLVEAIENICLQRFDEKFHRKPLANVQTKKQTED